MKAKLFKIELSDDAEIDFDESFEFYKKESHTIANKFYKSVDIAFKKIKMNPDVFPIVFKDIRKYNLEKFPFLIYYRIFQDVIQIIAIFHTSRNPKIWIERR